MENTWSWDKTAVDYALLEKVNPVFNTAKMTLFQLAANGDRDAAALVKSILGLYRREKMGHPFNTFQSLEKSTICGFFGLDTSQMPTTCVFQRSGIR